MLKISTLLVLLLSIQAFISAQNDTVYDYFSSDNKNNYNLKNDDFKQWKINAGTGAYFFNNASGFYTFLSPAYTTPLSDKFSIETGLIFTQGYFPYHVSDLASGSGLAQYNTTVYSKLLYRFDSGVFLTGSAYTSINPQFNNLSGKVIPNAFKGGSFGFGYNFKNNSSVYFEMRVNKGNNPFHPYGSPFGRTF